MVQAAAVVESCVGGGRRQVPGGGGGGGPAAAGGASSERRMKELTRENEPLHMLRVDDNRWMCLHCNLVSAYKRAIKLHVIAKHLEYKRYTCRYCGQVFKWNASRLDHERLSCPEKARLWMPFMQQSHDDRGKAGDTKNVKIKQLL